MKDELKTISLYTEKMYEQEVIDFEEKHGKDVGYIIDGKKIPKHNDKAIEVMEVV